MRVDAGDRPQCLGAGTSMASPPIDLALGHLLRHQRPDGGWSGRNNSMMLCLPLYVGAAYVARLRIDDDTKLGMIRLLRARQMPDGGWPLHIEGQSSVMMTTAMCYVAARMLGLPADDPAVRRARGWIRERGGPTGAGSLAKSFLAALGLFEHTGVDPVPPEFWLLPAAVHPTRLYGHMRANYVALAYLHGRRLVAPRDDLLNALREELYPVPYDRIDWRAARGHVASTDALIPRSRLIRAIDVVCAAYERHPSRRLRTRALRTVLEVLRAEDANTDYECFSLITKALHMLVWGIVEPDGLEIRRHAERLSIYLEHEDPDGIDARTCSSPVQWDTALAIQAIVATGRAPEHPAALENAYAFLASRQIQTEPVSIRGHRSRALGGWSFSEHQRHWPVIDCTAEALRACLQAASLVEHPLPPARLRDAADYILHHQNKDGGWPAYERARAPGWISLLNRSDAFDKVMCDFSHVECTGSCMKALVEYRERFPTDRPLVVADALARGQVFLRRTQRADGSWLGHWGVCFTYATWFAIEGLRAVGVSPGDEAMQRAILFLQSRQRTDGSWSESAEGNRRYCYVPSKEGHPVMTAWALLALVAAGCKGSDAVRRGVAFLVHSQEADGGWRSPGISGAFMCMHAMAYGSHVRIFPLWALAAADEGKGFAGSYRVRA
jgi:squalene/oxidosqualene cyclase-like protein